MVEKLGKIAFSFLISNWIYSETMLFFPGLQPYAQRLIEIAKIPTHNEWPGIIYSKDAKKLGTEINNYLASSKLAPAFVKVGILDPAVQKLMALRQNSSGLTSVDPETPLSPYDSGENIFVSRSAKGDLKGGYHEFQFS